MKKFVLTKESVLKDILKNVKNAEEILMGFGMHCLHCPCAISETLEEACEVHEIDVDLESELAKKLDGVDNVDIVFQDFLTSDLIDDVAKYSHKHLYFVSNVPYYITTPILMKLINSGLKFEKIVMMVQKEVGDRFSTSCGSREYGSISVLLQYYFDVKKEFLVSRNQFVPVPNVDSVIVSFSEKQDRLQF